MNGERALRILICSNGSEGSDRLVRTAALIAGPGAAETTLLGIRERRLDEDALHEVLLAQQRVLENSGAKVELVSAPGEPVEEIVHRAEEGAWDLVAIGASRTYRIVKAVRRPVLVVLGEAERVKRILLSVGDTRRIGTSVEIAGRIARAAAAHITLVHIVAQPPAMHAGLRRRQSDTASILKSDPVLAHRLREAQGALARLRVESEIRVGHGFVIDEVLAERRRGEHDLLVVGSVPAGAGFRSYFLGDMTREILDGADCPVLVVRTGEPITRRLWRLGGRVTAPLRDAVKPDRNTGR